MYAELRSVWVATQPIIGMAYTAALVDRWLDATRLYAAATAMAESVGAQSRHSQSHLSSQKPTFEFLGLRGDDPHFRHLEAAQDELPPDEFAREWEHGRALSFRDVVEDAVAVATAVAAVLEATQPASPASVAAAGSGHSATQQELTRREREVLFLLGEGCSNRDIGQRLTLSVRTVENHIAHIYAKLRVTGRVEAALLAARRRA